MAKQYRWRTITGYQSTTTMSYGVIPNTYENWQTSDVGTSQSADAGYWYRDSNTSWQGTFQDLLSSRAIYYVQQSWTSSVNNSTNVLTVVVNTKITSIQRDDIRHPTGYYDQDTPCRDIYIYDGATGSQVLHTQDCQIATQHEIYGEVNFNTQTFVLQPGTSTTTQTIEVHNQTTGGPSYDDIWIGVQFENTLPAPVTYTLTYDANGGTGAPAADTAYTVDDTHTFTVTNSQPTWGSFIFLGWSNSPVSGSGTPADVDYVAGDTITLPRSNLSKTIYAVWEKDYRPGTSLDTGTSVWKSHNRTNGAAHVLSNTGNMTWTEMRTIGGAENEQGNPPVLARAANATSFYNQKKLGQE